MKRELSFHNNINFIYKDAEADSKKQLEQIEELTKSNIDILIVSPNEIQPLSAEIEKIFDSGIPVVLVDRRISSDKYTAFVGASNFEVGQNAGRYAVSLLKGKGNVIEVMGLSDASPFIDRHKGFMDIISQQPGINYLKKLEDHTVDYQKNLANTLLTEKNIDLIFAQSDYIALDVYKICKQTSVDKRVKIIGVDGLPFDSLGMGMVANKFIAATVLYPTGGQAAIQTAVNILEGKLYQKENQLATTIIDSANVRVMKLQNDKMTAQQKDIDRRQQKIEQQKIITKNQVTIIYTISISLALALIFGFVLLYYLRENRKINAQLAFQNEEISNQRNQLIELGKKAKEASDAKINFFTNISHEFRTPLTLILAPIEEMKNNSKLDYSTKQNIAFIEKNSIRLLKLINELIDFRKIESDKMKLQASENDIVLFIEEIIGAFKVLARKRNIDLRLISKERSLNVYFDASMLDKVIFNLLSNAFKFTNDNGFIYVTIEKNSVDKSVIIKVEDNGIGMSPDVAEHAFELFYQGNASNKLGSGLGLSLSKELIQLHHGSISVTSKQGKGTTFTITLPLATDHLDKDEIVTEVPTEKKMYYDERIFSSESNNGSINSENTVNENKSDNTILIIEDNNDLREYLAENLSKNYQVIETNNGITAIQMAFDNVPDLIVSDISLPGKDGITITNTLKSDIRTSHIPIILLTAKIEVQQQIEGMKNLADAYIVKPFNLKYLEETIKSILKNRDVLREHYTSELPVELKSQSPKKIDKKFINDFAAIVESNISNEDFSIDNICKTIGISRIQLYRKVKALLGCNVNDYILTVRLQKAKYFLNKPDLSIAEIADNVGFSSAAYFSTVFKSKFNVTPSEFRIHKSVEK
ncbi:MAG: substrate-binding domain-containing protein, partial [Parafilimonas sp.]